jgi:spore maturation protein CgeB
MPQTGNPLRIVIILSRGVAAPHIMRGLAAGFEALGHSVLIADTRPVSSTDMNAFLERTRERILDFKPHFAAFYNSSGLLPKPPGMPETHKGRHFFEALEIPCAALFFDSPLLPVFLQDISILHASPLYHVFVWDRHYARILRERFGQGHYLPLGTDPAVFRPREPDPGHTADIAFIGSVADSGDFAAQRGAGGWPPLLISLAQQTFEAWLGMGGGDMDALLQSVLQRQPPALANAMRQFMNNAEQHNMFLQSVLSQIARHQRLEAVRALPECQVSVYGGPGWADLGLAHARAHAPVDYENETPVVYSSAKIILNVSSVQLATALNQRAFDAPACGGFLLTDWREDAAALFTPGEEIAVYRDLEELCRLAAFYLENGDERRAMAARARARVLRDHTWERRAGSIIKTLNGISALS